MVRSLCIDAKWMGDLTLNEEALDYLKSKNAKKIALFSAVNFLHNEPVREQLTNLGYEILLTKAKRTHKEGQILGCDSYHGVFDRDIITEADVLLYVGDGMFHPEALLFAQMYQKDVKEVLCWNPVDQKVVIIGKQHIQARMLKTKGNLLQYLNARIIGVLVSVKPGQEFMQMAKVLKERLEAQGKKVYVFVDDTFEYRRLEDYAFIDVWVNTACPRIGQDDAIVMPKPMVNINEALSPEKALERIHVTKATNNS